MYIIYFVCRRITFWPWMYVSTSLIFKYLRHKRFLSHLIRHSLATMAGEKTILQFFFNLFTILQKLLRYHINMIHRSAERKCLNTMFNLTLHYLTSNESWYISTPYNVFAVVRRMFSSVEGYHDLHTTECHPNYSKITFHQARIQYCSLERAIPRQKRRGPGSEALWKLLPSYALQTSVKRWQCFSCFLFYAS